MVSRAAGCNAPEGKINSRRRSAPNGRDLARASPDDGPVTVTMSGSARLASACHRPGDSCLRRRSGKSRDCANLSAHAGCVWCVTVKDPGKVSSRSGSPAVQSRSQGRPQAERAQPARDFSTSRNRGSLYRHSISGRSEISAGPAAGVLRSSNRRAPRCRRLLGTDSIRRAASVGVRVTPGLYLVLFRVRRSYRAAIALGIGLLLAALATVAILVVGDPSAPCSVPYAPC